MKGKGLWILASKLPWMPSEDVSERSNLQTPRRVMSGH